MKALGLLTTAILVCGTAGATTITETFTYSDGDLAGKGNSSEGWTGSWGVDGNQSMVVSGQVATCTGGSNLKNFNYRAFESALSITAASPTIWLSWDMKMDIAGTAGYDYVALVDGEAGAFGRPMSNSGNWSAFYSLSDPYYADSGVSIPDGVWSSLCVKLVPTGDGIASGTMWVNPNYSLAEDDPSQVAPILTFTTDFGNTSVTTFQLRSRSYDANVTSFDNIRVSDESSLFVPEPTTMGLLTVGAIALFRRRR
jgi:hypothetical protein